MDTDFDLKLFRLSSNDYPLRHFDCGDDDLNDFFLNDSKVSNENLLSVTYALKNGSDIIALFSLLNDKISISDVDSNNQWRKKFKDKMPKQELKYNSYPAMKIGRLGISNPYKRQGWGTTILDYLKQLFISENRTGCRYITVDAYNCKESLALYEKNGFFYLTNKDKTSDTRLMCFDLIQITTP